MNPNQEAARPSPEAMLRAAHAEEQEARRGRLKIFLGYAAGVGKTYTMLEAARQLKAEGRDVVAAYVESHGRAETDALLAGLEVLPKAQYEHQGVMLTELDLDATLARRPELALVDELAHANAPGCRHDKRWQDIEELLVAGIDVFTTVNVQHFESASDIVAQITGVPIRETVPDSLLDLASEILLVDIPPEDLLHRLRQGKVYVPQQASQAVRRFFRPGNLIALRELAMRRAAARVDEEMRSYMEVRSIPGPWPVAERLLVCASGSPFSEQLIRTTRRLADELKAKWFTVYVETPGLAREQSENRERVWRDLRLAESLGAEVATLTAASVPQAVIDYAVRHNVTRIVVGKPTKPRWRELLRPPIVDRLIRLSGAIHIHVVSFNQELARRPAPPRRLPLIGAWSQYLTSLALVAATTLLSFAVYPYVSPTNLVMVYLLNVVLVAVRSTLKQAIFTAALGVLAFDFFFIEPRWSFTVADTQYAITFFGLFTVGVVIATLVTKARARAETLRHRELQTESLYYLSRDLAAAIDMPSILAAVLKNIDEALHARLAVLMPRDELMHVAAASDGLIIDEKELVVADWVCRNRQPAGHGAETLSSARLLHLPLMTAGHTFGTLGIALHEEAEYCSPTHRRLLDAFVAQISLAMERVHLANQAEQAQMLRARESLERSMLNSISHDLKTPLAAMGAAMKTLRAKTESLSDQGIPALVNTIWDEIERLNRFVGNLLDMTSLEAGDVQVHARPCDVQDLIADAMTVLEEKLTGRDVSVTLAEGLPQVEVDPVLMTQVLVNLLDNGLNYSPPDSLVEIAARVEGDHLRLEVLDRGPGVPGHELHRIFEKFFCLPAAENGCGAGLGLAICRGIVEAHNGTIRAENRSNGGLRIICLLPLSEPSR